MGKLIALLVTALALLGAPLFAVMGGWSELLWLVHDNAQRRFLRFLASDILTEQFAGSPILVTIPLFTFAGYLLAESKAPNRIVRASTAFLGWLPGGLAIVCILASTVFTVVTGGSGVTIVAVGGLLYPALVEEGYPKDYALGLVTTGGSLGLLLPFSVPLMVYALVAGIDTYATFKAGLIPAFIISFLLAVHAFVVATRHKLPRSRPNLREMASAFWLIKWELLIPVVLFGSLFSGLAADIGEAAAVTAIYTLVVEVFVHEDLSLKKDLPRVAKAAMSLAGAIIIILSMANALMNYVNFERIPNRVLEAMASMGLSKTWQFLVILNIFLLVLGMLMEGFSAILIAVPLVLPFAATFGLHPFHLAIMLVLNLEIAYVAPPLGLNLFISSFRFERPVTSLYRIVLPFTGILAVGLLLIMYIPKLSTVLIEPDIAREYRKAAAAHEAPRQAWLLQCVQEDRSNPKPCNDEDKAKFGPDGTKNPYEPEVPVAASAQAEAERPDAGAAENSGDMDALLKEMLGEDGGAAPPASAPKPSSSANQDEELLKEMLGK